MTIFEKTWTIYSGIIIPQPSSTAELYRSYMWKVKELLKDDSLFPDGYWTVVGSGITASGGMDDVDRWTAFTDINAANNWICLESQSSLGKTGSVYLTIIYFDANDDFTYILSDTKPTGGGANSPPTQDGYYFSTTKTFTTNATSTQYTYVNRVHIGMTQDGGFYIFNTYPLERVYYNLIGFLEIESVHSEEPYDICFMFHNVSSGSIVNIITMWSTNGITSDTVSANFILPTVDSLYSEFSIDQFTGKAAEFPLFIAVTDTMYITLKGRIYDITLASDKLSDLTVEPENGQIESIKIGRYWFPMNQKIIL